MNGIQVIHDSQNIKYRKPFGAVESGQKVELSIDINKSLLVAVEIVNFDGSKFNMGMEKRYLNNGKFRYSVQINTSDALGILGYYFIIIDGYNRVYYGNNEQHLGGIGQMYNYNPVPYQITVYEKSSVPEWYKEGVIYQILIDRFFNGNEDKSINSPKKNSFIYARWDDDPMYIKDHSGRIVRWDFFGGNIKGILKKLDYIKGLGANILCLSPIFKSSSYHKYDTGDYESIDEMLGSEEEFKTLCAEADKKGIKIILDSVFSYTSADSRYFNKSGNYKTIGAYQSPNSKYYNWYKFMTYPYKYESWWGIDTRPNLNTMNEEYINYIAGGEQSIIDKWNDLGISGLRLNITDELPDEFIQIVRDKIKSIDNNNVILGEVWEDASNKVSYSKRRRYLYGKELDSVTNYPLRENLINFVKGYVKSDTLKRRIMCMYENYPKENFYRNMNIIGTHDTERILTVLDGQIELMKLVAVIQITLPGVPLIYYGDEAGLAGGNDPDNRRTYPWGNENKDLLTFYHDLIALRNKESSLRRGSFKIYDTEPSIFAFERSYKSEKILVIINTSGREKIVKNIKVSGQYEDIFDSDAKYTFMNREGSVTVFSRSFKILRKI